tara:strand:- start:136 stop:477 length:342 start_codon:yes stop_codon:yes gene_type:complete
MFRYKIQDLQVSNSQKKSSTSTILIALLVAGSLIAVLTIALSCGKKDVNTKEKYAQWDLRHHHKKRNHHKRDLLRDDKDKQQNPDSQHHSTDMTKGSVLSDRMALARAYGHLH